MVPGARSKFGATMFEPEVFRKQMYCIEKSTCDIVGTYWHSPQTFSTPILIRRRENCSPLPPSLRLWVRRPIAGPLAWVLVEICRACLHSNQNINITATKYSFQRCSQKMRPSILGFITQSLSISTFILMGPSMSQARLQCTSCSHVSLAMCTRASFIVLVSCSGMSLQFTHGRSFAHRGN